LLLTWSGVREVRKPGVEILLNQKVANKRKDLLAADLLQNQPDALRHPTADYAPPATDGIVTVEDVPERLASLGFDPWAGMRAPRQSIGTKVRRDAGIG
jgi:hypothetical protein